jgi:hypothetical protein
MRVRMKRYRPEHAAHLRREGRRRRSASLNASIGSKGNRTGSRSPRSPAWDDPERSSLRSVTTRNGPPGETVPASLTAESGCPNPGADRLIEGKAISPANYTRNSTGS